MSEATRVFEAQFDDADDLQEMKEQFVCEYVSAELDQEDDPLEVASEALLEYLEWDVEPTREALEPWLDEMSEQIKWQRIHAMARREVETTVQSFHKLRGEGRTVLSAARSLKKDPSFDEESAL